jgi:hypothetical protein
MHFVTIEKTKFNRFRKYHIHLLELQFCNLCLNQPEKSFRLKEREFFKDLPREA